MIEETIIMILIGGLLIGFSIGYAVGRVTKK